MNDSKLLRAKVGILLSNPFFATLMLHKNFIEDKSIKSCVTNGRDVRYNPEYFESLPPDELKGVIAAELMHTSLLHHTRREGRDIEVWNKATDAVLHPIIRDAGFALPKDAYFNPDFEGKTAEDAYKILWREKQEQQNKPQGQPQGADQGQGGAGQPDQDNGQGKPGQPQQGQQKPDIDPSGCGGVEDAPAQTQAEMDAKEQEAKFELAQAYQMAKGKGNIPAGFDRLIEEILEPKVNWHEVLARFLSEVAHNDYTFSRPNVRYLGTGFILPSLYNVEAGEIVLIVDTSGSVFSVKKLLDKFAGEMQDICSSFNTPFTVIYVDTKVQGTQTIEPDDVFKLEPKGGGGTSFKPGFKWLEENNIEPKCVVYFTDLDCDSYPPEPSFPVLWASYGDRKRQPLFGEKINID